MLFDRLKRVKAFIFTVDGVLTDGKIWLMPNGEPLYRIHSMDRYALQLALQRDYPVAVVGSRIASGIKLTMETIGIRNVFYGVNDKRAIWRDWLTTLGLQLADVLYMGADMPDVGNMADVGLATCPANAAEEIKTLASYISFREGGDGAVRDVIEKVMKLQHTWI